MSTLRFFRGQTEAEASLSLVHTRLIVALSVTGAEHCAMHPRDVTAVFARVAQTIEGALQSTPAAHRVWLRLCEDPLLPINVEITLRGADGLPALTAGAGGAGAFPGGGGGGGGSGGGGGGRGGDGMLVLFLRDAAERVVDVVAFVTPGKGTWTCPPGIWSAKAVGCGGGGGGGGGGV